MQGDHGQLHFTFVNGARLPLFYAKCRIALDGAVEIGEEDAENGTKFTADFSLGPLEKITMTMPMIAKKRGIAKIRTLEVTIKDPFNLISANLFFNQLVKKEVIVHPRPLAIRGLTNMMLAVEGKLPMAGSIYNDHTALMGTRNYSFNDPFRYIHWKASARTGQLQTKLFEKVIGMTWTIILLIEPNYNYMAKEDLERQLSIAAFMIQFAENRGMTYNVFVNIKIKGSGETVSIPVDSGIQQLIKAWDLLAFINLGQIRTKVNLAMNEIDKAMIDKRVIMMFYMGNDHDKNHLFYRKWSKRGHVIYKVNSIEGSPVLAPLYGRGEAVAK
ncbi:DUF58 domain-containing protein [Scopulibacillus cellulosilyticus]|uniref:DUF58 domain-containing protein n=1 Tax=Scopulibacillus cellulosilyticus TaxID=2665665 RepID=A0ABW2PWI5_9BACL